MVRVIVVDDHDGFRAALEAVLRATVDLRVVGSASNAQEAIALAARLVPDVVVMDLVMPGVNGVEATRRLRCSPRPPPVIALSGSRALMREAVAAGAALTFLKDADPADLIAGIRTLAGAGLNFRSSV
jgi:DNA-binding NarL/FixJ family response regulator